jgi:D-amino peptidase
MRIYISADIEGICGVVTKDHTKSGGCEYESARNWMTSSVVAVCETAHELGAKEIIVSDSHGNGINIKPDLLPDFVQLVRAWPRPLGMVQGIDNGKFDACFLVGYHAGGSNIGGGLSHTLSSVLFQEIKINGIIASEAYISAAIAGLYDVPILMFAGDDVAISEARETFGNIAYATLKEAYGIYSAIFPSQNVALERLRIATKEAVSLIGKTKPLKIAEPIEIELTLRTRSVAEWLSYLPNTERLSAFKIRYKVSNITEMSRFLMFVIVSRSMLEG